MIVGIAFPSLNEIGGEGDTGRRWRSGKWVGSTWKENGEGKEGNERG